MDGNTRGTRTLAKSLLNRCFLVYWRDPQVKSSLNEAMINTRAKSRFNKVPLK